LTELERAYVVAGIVGTGVTPDRTYIILRASAANYGKTPGFIDSVHWHVGPFGEADPEELPITGDGYQNHIFVGWVISADTSPAEELKTNEIGSARLPMPSPLIFHGLITYTDIFGTGHYCGFAYRINENGTWQPISRLDAYARRN
jgi:hypothetical protein